MNLRELPLKPTTLAAIMSAAILATASSNAAEIVAQYLLDGDAQDSGPSAFHGTVNDATFVADPDRGTVASFLATGSQSINIGVSGLRVTENANDADGNAQFAISMWIKPTALNPAGGNDVNILMGGTSGVIEIIGDGSWNGFGGVHGSIGANSGGGAGDAWKVPSIDVYDGEWHHVVIQWKDEDLQSGGTSYFIELYVDGVLGEDTNGNEYNGNGNGTDLSLGGPAVHSNGGSRNKYYTGLMSDVRFYDDQLTAEEVTAIFTGSTFTPPSLTLEIDSSGSDLVFTWDSQAGMVYDIRSSTDPEADGDPATWSLWQDNVPATPDTNVETFARPGDDTTFFVLLEEEAPFVDIYTENFESGIGGWTTGSDGVAGTVWELGTPIAVGPPTANGGTNCFGTDLNDNYSLEANIWLRSPASPGIDLTSATAAKLTFWHWVDMDAFNFGDTGTVRVLDATVLPGTVTQLAVVQADIQGTIPGGWVQFTMDLPSPALGKTIALEFRLMSDDFEDDATFPGWYIDDISVGAR